MLPSILATIVLLYWVLQGAQLTVRVWTAGYHPIWALLQVIVTLALLLPLWLVWA